MLKVLYFIPGFNFGGIETTTRNIMNNINEENIQIEIAVEQRYYKIAKSELSNDNYVIHIIPNFAVRNMFNYLREIDKLLKSNDFTVLQSFNITRTPIYFYYGIKNKVKNRIYHARTTATSINLFRRITFRILIVIGSLLSTNRYACSNKAGKFFFGKRSFEIIKNGVEVERFLFSETKRSEYRRKYKVENKFLVGHIGRFTEAKNHFFILEVFQNFLMNNKNSKLILVGDGPLRDKVFEKAKELKIADDVIFMGYQQNVEDYFQMFDLFLFPSIYEGFGNVVIEAQVSGLPVLCSTALPQEVKITNIVDFIDLVESKVSWAKRIQMIKETAKNRHSDLKLIRESGYDTKQISLDLEKKYLEMR